MTSEPLTSDHEQAIREFVDSLKQTGVALPPLTLAVGEPWQAMQRLLASLDAARAERDEALEVARTIRAVDDAEIAIFRKKVEAERDAAVRAQLRAIDNATRAGCAYDRAWAVVHQVADAFRLVLPLARGYAAEHPVGSNQKFVEEARAVLDGLPSPGQKPRAVEDSG